MTPMVSTYCSECAIIVDNECIFAKPKVCMEFQLWITFYFKSFKNFWSRFVQKLSKNITFQTRRKLKFDGCPATGNFFFIYIFVTN